MASRGSYGGQRRGGRGGSGGGGGGKGGIEGGRGGHGGPLAVHIPKSGQVALPDPAVHKKEDEAVKASSAAFSELSLQVFSVKDSSVHPLPFRPGYGTQGRQITLFANYLTVTNTSAIKLYKYNIEIKVGKDKEGKNERLPSRRITERLVQLAIDQQMDGFCDRIATDHRSTIISASPINIPQGPFQVTFGGPGEKQTHSGGKSFQMRITPTGSVNPADLVRYLSSNDQSTHFERTEDIIQALNIILGHNARSDPHIASLSNNKHFPIEAASEKWNLGAGLEALRGYIISVRPATSRLLLNIQIKHAAVYQEGSLIDLMNSFISSHGRDMRKLQSFLKKVRVRISYVPSKRKFINSGAIFKSICGLATVTDGRALEHAPVVSRLGASATQVKFWLNGTFGGARKSGLVSVSEFFKRTYNITSNTSLPVINVGNTANPVYLPPNVAFVVRGQPCTAKLDPQQTQQMISGAVRKAHENALSITTKGVETIDLPTNPILNGFNLRVGIDLLTVQARILSSPNVMYRNKIATCRFGSWNMASTQFSQPMKLPIWTVLMISIRGRENLDAFNNSQQLAATVKAFYENMKSCGMTGPEASKLGLGKITLNGNDGDGRIVEGAFQALMNIPTASRPGLVLVILPKNDGTIYNHIKRVCDLRFGFHSICVVGSKLAKHTFDGNAQYFANVALKVNIRLGGKNQVLPQGKLGIIDAGATMVVGIDVTHPSPQSEKNAPSVAAIVASTDRTLAQFPAQLRLNPARQEPVEALKEMMQSRLRLWANLNRNNFPENIIIYRDGVSDGQYHIVLKQELSQIRAACAALYPATDTARNLPRVSIIICSKRHNTRFYPTKTADADRGSSPQNGTVVDRGITQVSQWDFFLQSHTAIQGTARPAHYIMILDEIFRRQPIRAPFRNAADLFEDLNHNMSYLHCRATKAVSLCPPAYYADVACERARRYLSDVFDPSVAGSTAASVNDGQQREVVVNASDILVHPRLENTMFYI